MRYSTRDTGVGYRWGWEHGILTQDTGHRPSDAGHSRRMTDKDMKKRIAKQATGHIVIVQSVFCVRRRTPQTAERRGALRMLFTHFTTAEAFYSGVFSVPRSEGSCLK